MNDRPKVLHLGGIVDCNERDGCFRPCKYCGATVMNVIRGSGAHRAGLACAECGKKGRWLPAPFACLECLPDCDGPDFTPCPHRSTMR